MLTFYHAPQSRSSAIAVLIEEMDIAHRIDMRLVSIGRMDGSGTRDPSNPHPEGKAPVLVDDGHVITERGAIMLYLTTLFPECGLAPAAGTPEWGSYVTWLTWYQGVMEPILIQNVAGLKHPALDLTFRGMPEVTARIAKALELGPWLLGETFSAADILVHSPFAFFEGSTPDVPVIQDWVERCKARPARLRVQAADTERMAKLAA